MKLSISLAPHVRGNDSVRSIMLDVIIALFPATAFGVYLFGLRAAVLIFLSILSAVLAEYAWQRLSKREVRVGDLSAVVTGLIFELNLPQAAPWWIAVLGSAFAIVIVKQLFGGIGDNFLNPAITARAVMLASWPVYMTTFTAPTYFTGVEAATSATPLAGLDKSYYDLFMGNVPGCIGEVCKAAILIGFIYLLLRKVISWQIPVVMVATAALGIWIFGGNGGLFTGEPLRAVLSGGLLFGAVFMATDYTTSPMTGKGQIVFAAGCGLLVAIIRSFGSYPEGVTYAIMLMNVATPLIDKFIAPKLYGEVRSNA